MSICGAYGTPRNLFGEEGLAYVYYDDPDLIYEIMRWWVDFYTKIDNTVTKEIEIDYVFMWEDMAFKTGPLISPEMFKTFMSPYYDELIDAFKSAGIDIILVDTDGNAEVLLDLFIDAGVNTMMPFEIAAGMEPVKIRKRLGHKLAMIGGIDKREVARGPEAIKIEVMSKVPQLLEDGGFIPTLDHSTPPDISFDNHRCMTDLLNRPVGSFQNSRRLNNQYVSRSALIVYKETKTFVEWRSGQVDHAVEICRDVFELGRSAQCDRRDAAARPALTRLLHSRVQWKRYNLLNRRSVCQKHHQAIDS